jgi:hypothetical protein
MGYPLQVVFEPLVSENQYGLHFMIRSTYGFQDMSKMWASFKRVSKGAAADKGLGPFLYRAPYGKGFHEPVQHVFSDTGI